MYLREFIQIAHIEEYTKVLCFNDDGGISEYVLWYFSKKNEKIKLITVPNKGTKIDVSRFNKEVVVAEGSLINALSFLTIDDTYETHTAANLDSLFQKADELGCSPVNLIIFGRKKLLYEDISNQEIEFQRYLITYMHIMFNMLANNGNVVITMYDNNLPITNAFLFILHKIFGEVSIIKPYSTRLYNSERFVVCTKYKKKEKDIHATQFINLLFSKKNDLIKDGKLINNIIDIKLMQKDEKFIEYVREQNSIFAEWRINALTFIEKKFINNADAELSGREDAKTKCLELWGVPSIGTNYSGTVLCGKKYVETIEGFNSYGDIDKLIERKSMNKVKKRKHVDVEDANESANADKKVKLTNIEKIKTMNSKELHHFMKFGN